MKKQSTQSFSFLGKVFPEHYRCLFFKLLNLCNKSQDTYCLAAAWIALHGVHQLEKRRGKMKSCVSEKRKAFNSTKSSTCIVSLCLHINTSHIQDKFKSSPFVGFNKRTARSRWECTFYAGSTV